MSIARGVVSMFMWMHMFVQYTMWCKYQLFFSLKQARFTQTSCISSIRSYLSWTDRFTQVDQPMVKSINCFKESVIWYPLEIHVFRCTEFNNENADSYRKLPKRSDVTASRCSSACVVYLHLRSTFFLTRYFMGV